MTAGKKVRYYGKKLLVFLLSVLALSLLVFYLARLAPGDRWWPITASGRRR